MTIVTHRDCHPSSCGVLAPLLPIGGDKELGKPDNSLASGYWAAQQTMANPPPRSFPRVMGIFTPFARVPTLEARRGQTQEICFVSGYHRLARLGRICEELSSEE